MVIKRNLVNIEGYFYFIINILKNDFTINFFYYKIIMLVYDGRILKVIFKFIFNICVFYLEINQYLIG